MNTTQNCSHWICCPACGGKTRIKVYEDTVLERFPLYCPKCKQETLISVRELNTSIIEPYLQDNIAYLDEYLRKYTPKIKLIQPEGTYLMWLDCRNMEFSRDELDHFFTDQAQVALDKGFWFGEEGAGFIRMNIACPRRTLKQALQQISIISS